MINDCYFFYSSNVVLLFFLDKDYINYIVITVLFYLPDE